MIVSEKGGHTLHCEKFLMLIENVLRNRGIKYIGQLLYGQIFII